MIVACRHRRGIRGSPMRMSKVFPRFAFPFVLLAYTLLASAAERPNKFPVSDKQMNALGIQVNTLERQSGRVMASFPGQVMIGTDQEQVVSAPMAGVVLQVLVQQNQSVRQGAPLLRIAGAEFGQQQLQLLQTASRANLARLAAQREESLFSEGIIPQRRVYEAQAALKETEAAFNQAKAQLILSGMDSAAIARVASGGKLETSLTLTAAKAGVVSRLEVKPGQRVEPASAILHLMQTDRLSLDIQVPADAASRWPSGTRIKLQNREAVGRIVSVSPVATAGSQTVSIRAVIENGASGLRAGESVVVEFPTAEAKDSWDVPLSAVVHDGGKAFVFVRTPEGFEARPVMVLAQAGQRLQLKGSLKAGEQIANSGVVALKAAWMGAVTAEKGGG